MKRLLLLLAIPLAACTVTDTDSGKTRQPDSGAARAGVKYICESGESAYARYRENGMSLKYKGRDHRLKIAISASGARYVGDGLVWWNKGEENTLFKLVDGDKTGEKIDSCREAPRKKQ